MQEEALFQINYLQNVSKTNMSSVLTDQDHN